MIALTGCNRRGDDGPVIVSLIGEPPALADPARRAMSLPDRVLTDALAQGLVGFDAAGQVEPGLAERWTVIDGGRSYIFRLREAKWGDGRDVTAAQAVTILKREIASPRNPLSPYLTAIDDVVEMTPQVIEVRLARPRPDLLKLFAQPELAVIRLNPPGGSGPFRVQRRMARGVMLLPAEDPNRAEDEKREPDEADNVRLIGERAARSILRFVAKDSDLVLGGTFLDWPLIAIGDVAPANVRPDPTAGIFGFAIVRRAGFLEGAANRAALSSAFDRAALLGVLGPGAVAADTLLPDRLDSAQAPVPPAWTAQSLDQRQAELRRRVAAWRTANGGQLMLSIALPAGPGANLFYGQVAATLITAGITPIRVSMEDPAADLRLVDAVAPYDSARWYLNRGCAPCGDAARQALEDARLAPTLAERGRAVAAADAAMAADTSFILLSRPPRWSLVAIRLRQWQGNPRAWHPLNHLRNDPDK